MKIFAVAANEWFAGYNCNWRKQLRFMVAKAFYIWFNEIDLKLAK